MQSPNASPNYFSLPQNNPVGLHVIRRKNQLTFVEELVIALVMVNQYVYIRNKGETITNGHNINFPQKYH